MVELADDVALVDDMVGLFLFDNFGFFHRFDAHDCPVLLATG